MDCHGPLVQVGPDRADTKQMVDRVGPGQDLKRNHGPGRAEKFEYLMGWAGPGRDLLHLMGLAVKK